MRLIDADALEEFLLNDSSCLTVFEAIRKTQSMPTIDAVPVVRCRECKYFVVTKDNDLHLKVNGCYRLKKLGEEYPLVVRGDGFCSWGQRREDGDA